MKKKIAMIVSLVCLIVNCTPVFATESTQIKYVTAPSGLNIRVKPTTKSKKLRFYLIKQKLQRKNVIKNGIKLNLENLTIMLINNM